MNAIGHDDENRPAATAAHARRGAFLLVIFVLLFAEFLFVTIHSPAFMARTDVPFTETFTLHFGGANVAFVAGVSQLLAGLLLAFLYVRAARPGKY